MVDTICNHLCNVGEFRSEFWATVWKMVRPMLSHHCLGPGHIVLDGDPAPPPKGTAAVHYSAHVYCGQTAGWIKMPLGTEGGLGAGDIVLDGDPASPQKGTQSPNFRPMSVVAKRLDASRCHSVRR